MNYCKQETMVRERWFIAISFCLALDNILFSRATRLHFAKIDLHYNCLKIPTRAITKVLRVDFDETYRISEYLILIVYQICIKSDQ